jgi:type II secretory pathway component GspD/PulD (secretin)
VAGDDFGFFVNAVESNSDFVAISRPTVFTTNNHEARISSGARIAVPTSTFTGNNVSGGQSTNVEFRDVVLELVVLPLVNDENTVTLQISLVRDDVGEDRTIGELVVPDIITDELTTTVTVPNKSTIILGGLITETDRNSKSGVPLLMNIPGLGRLFSRTTQALERQELVIMIHPSIISSDRQLDNYQWEYDAGSVVAPKSRASVGGNGVLPPRGTVAAPYYDRGAQPAGTPPQRRTPPSASTRPDLTAAPGGEQDRRIPNHLRNKRRR